MSAEERATIMLMSRDEKGVREIGRFLNRSPGTISREMDRHFSEGIEYDASLTGEQASFLRIKPRKRLKLVADGVLFGVVVDHLKKKWSPEQIAGKLKLWRLVFESAQLTLLNGQRIGERMDGSRVSFKCGTLQPLKNEDTQLGTFL